ncbi:MAG: AlpA family transcriptional regulator [Halioglobus sp.]|nr:AlpA family transcriptional regulator [Halioglobus sp.]
MSHTILRRPSVESRTGLSRSSIYRMIREGKFPPPVRLGKRSVGWDSVAVQAWIDECIKCPTERA